MPKHPDEPEVTHAPPSKPVIPVAPLTLAQLSDTQSAIVIGIAGADTALKHRLYALGLVPGSQITRMRTAPFGDPLQVRVGGSSLSIRTCDAVSVIVSQ